MRNKAARRQGGKAARRHKLRALQPKDQESTEASVTLPVKNLVVSMKIMKIQIEISFEAKVLPITCDFHTV